MIIDANVHATPDGRWFDTGHDASAARLTREMDEAGVDRAVVTGLVGAGGTDAVVGICETYPDRLVPVGAIDPGRFAGPADAAAAVREELLDRGLAGVKLHPRLGRYDLLDPRALAVLDALAESGKLDLVWVCTFLHYPGARLLKPPVETLHEVVGRYPSLRFVLAHGGGPDVLRLAAAVRPLPNAHLDLSFTLTAYRGSSLDLDVAHLLRTFESRLLFGSDFPEVGPRTALEGFEAVADGLGSPSREKVLGGNAAALLGWAEQEDR